MEQCFPEARQILDYYHCMEHLHTVAEARYEDPDEALSWVIGTIGRLYNNEAGRVLGGPKWMKPKNEAAKDQIDN